MRLSRLTLPVLTLAIGLIVGLWYGQSNGSSTSASTSMQMRNNEGTFTNPLLECDVAEDTITALKINFKAELEKFVHTMEDRTSVQRIAVYFRDLNNGPTFGIQQNDPFIPASLLKVPVMMAYFSETESDPNILQKKLLFTKSAAPDIRQTILPAQHLTSGKEYSINELIKRMIVYSDNDALILLFKTLPIEDHRHLYNLLGVDSSVISDPTAALTVKQYAAFFRILFNASFISQKYSEEALTLLASTDFDSGLRKGVPERIPVAHKFGERQIATSEQHLHDCGIVYYPKHPYLLCVMTRGANTSTLERAIADISKFVYEKIDEQYR